MAQHRMSSRLVRRSGAPTLEVVVAEPEGRPEGPTLVLLHGAFAGAWMWREIFMPYWAKRSRRSVAVSLRGHGGSSGQKSLSSTTLADYLDDVREIIGECATPPVVIGHSLGGFLAQMLVGREKMRGLVLLASLPPDGMMFVGPQLALSDPLFWARVALSSVVNSRDLIQTAEYRELFSEHLSPAEVTRYGSMMTPEAPRALAETHLPQAIVSAIGFGIPTLVIGGGIDRLVWQASTLRTALFHGGEHRVAEGLGHFLMLDHGAERVAHGVLDWLDRKGI